MAEEEITERLAAIEVASRHGASQADRYDATRSAMSAVGDRDQVADLLRSVADIALRADDPGPAFDVGVAVMSRWTVTSSALALAWESRWSAAVTAADAGLVERLAPAALRLCLDDPSLRRRVVLPAWMVGEGSSADLVCLADLLAVLDEEPFVIIEPSSGLGIEATLGGVVDNFQLHMLLLDVFPQRGWRRPRRISATAAACARGVGPASLDETVTGAWDLRGAAGPDGGEGEMIWNEGRPTDIEAVDGVRLVVLAPASYRRMWNAGRRFAGLGASLQVDGRLTRAQVERWAIRSAGGTAQLRPADSTGSTRGSTNP